MGPIRLLIALKASARLMHDDFATSIETIEPFAKRGMSAHNSAGEIAGTHAVRAHRWFFA